MHIHLVSFEHTNIFIFLLKFGLQSYPGLNFIFDTSVWTRYNNHNYRVSTLSQFSRYVFSLTGTGSLT